MEKKRNLYISLEHSAQKRMKLVKIEQDETFNSLAKKIKDKFNLDEETVVSLSARLENNGPFVEVDETDEELLHDAIEVKMEIPNSTHPNGERPEANSASLNLGASSSKETTTSKATCNVYSIADLLHEHPKGRGIEQEYIRMNTLTPQTRMQLVNIVCADLVEKHGYYPNVQQKQAAAKAILSKYPTLRNPEGKTGYEHFYCSTGGQSGYIQTKLKNIRRSIPNSARQRPKLEKDSLQPPVSTTSKNTKQLIDETEANKLESLCRNLPKENRKEILEAMKQFTSNRHQWILTENPPMQIILQRFPAYLEFPELISQDFEELHSVEIGNRFLANWEACAEKLIQLATTSENPAITALLEEYTELLTEQPMSKDTVSLYGLQVLLLWLPSFNTRKKAKCSQADLMSSFLDCQPIGTNIEEYLEEKKSTKLPLQPLLLGIGQTLHAIQQYFIVADGIGILLGTHNITAAADLCFKFHYVFDFKYSYQLQSFYSFLQDVVYKLELRVPISKRVMELKLALQNVK